MSGEFPIGATIALSIVHEKAAKIVEGAPRRCSDAGIFSTSEMRKFLEAHFGAFPPPVNLGNVGRVAHHVLVDQGSRHTLRFMSPFR
ncbi:hypothetical protein Y032_0131g1637 [Ancylostoma ceylanicum]|uniref:Uncharacterized protein n=1 Tax=Ancylostoma ceylanicum TaxID=53326 RepID=A0A016T737_9BILA|nr:hypothetical protein Y032_0131g1637 [Ancylostoma ceylanicum]